MNEFLQRLHGEDRVLLVGDTRQHEAVEAGRPCHQLQEAGMQTARLDEIVWQKDPALKEAVEQLARGEVQDAIDNLDRRGCVHEIVGRNERLTEIARDYAREPHGTLVVSSDNESRRQLNGLIHRAMQERGDVSQYGRQGPHPRFAPGDDGRGSAVGRAVRGRRCGTLHARQPSARHRAR